MIDHKEARELYEYAIESDRINREEAEEDLRFRAGEQWPDHERTQREMDGRPALTINRTGQFIRRVTGAARQNPPSIKVVPAEDTDEAAMEAANVREGLIRRIEHRSRGRWVYIQALDTAATCGIGHIRIMTEYDERDPFQQEIRLAPISDPLSVVYDPDAKRLTKEDGGFVFQTGLMSPRAFKAKYPKADATEWSHSDTVNQPTRYWEQGETIRVVEMFERRAKKRKLVLMSDGARVALDGMKRADIEAMFAQAAAVGIEPVAEREVEYHEVFRSVLSGKEYLEDEVEFPSRYLPIIPVIGEEVSIGEVKVRHGLVRFTRDPQRLYNYWRTSAAEMVALAPKAPFMATATQIGPFKQMWDQANKKPLPYLLFQPDPDAPNAMPQRATAPEPPAAMWQEASVASDDMKGVTGIYDAALGAEGNETSGRAIMARQREGDVGTFLYVDNLRHAVERVGVTLLDMLPRIYDTERSVQVMEEDGSTRPFTINQTMPDGTVRNDLSTGVYEVKVSTGPTFQSKQEETSQAILELAKVFPPIMQIAGDILVKNLDFPRADEIAARMEQAMQGAQGGNPQQMQAAQMQMQMQAQAQQAQMAELMAKVEKLAAETDKVRAETAKIIGEVQAGPADMRFRMVEAEGKALDNAAKFRDLRNPQTDTQAR